MEQGQDLRDQVTLIQPLSPSVEGSVKTLDSLISRVSLIKTDIKGTGFRRQFSSVPETANPEPQANRDEDRGQHSRLPGDRTLFMTREAPPDDNQRSAARLSATASPWGQTSVNSALPSVIASPAREAAVNFVARSSVVSSPAGGSAVTFVARPASDDVVEMLFRDRRLAQEGEISGMHEVRSVPTPSLVEIICAVIGAIIKCLLESYRWLRRFVSRKLRRMRWANSDRHQRSRTGSGLEFNLLGRLGDVEAAFEESRPSPDNNFPDGS